MLDWTVGAIDINGIGKILRYAVDFHVRLLCIEECGQKALIWENRKAILVEEKVLLKNHSSDFFPVHNLPKNIWVFHVLFLLDSKINIREGLDEHIGMLFMKEEDMVLGHDSLDPLLHDDMIRRCAILLEIYRIKGRRKQGESRLRINRMLKRIRYPVWRCTNHAKHVLPMVRIDMIDSLSLCYIYAVLQVFAVIDILLDEFGYI